MISYDPYSGKVISILFTVDESYSKLQDVMRIGNLVTARNEVY